MQNSKAQLQAVSELLRFMFSLDLVIFCKKLFFLLIWWLEYFQKATVWYIDMVRAWNCTCRYYTKYKGLPNKFQILSWLTQAKNYGSKPHEFWSHKNCSNFKRASENLSTRFLICIRWLVSNKKFLAIPFHKNTKISTHSWYFWSQKGFWDRILGFGTKLSGPIAHSALHQKLWKF